MIFLLLAQQNHQQVFRLHMKNQSFYHQPQYGKLYNELPEMESYSLAL